MYELEEEAYIIKLYIISLSSPHSPSHTEPHYIQQPQTHQNRSTSQMASRI
jgi:hypothetical protein